MTENTNQTNLDWTKDEAYVAESRFIEYKEGEFISFWILRKQPNMPGDFQPIVETLEDGKGNKICNEIKDKAGNIVDKTEVRKATWDVVDASGKLKKWSCTLGGKKSLYEKVKSRIIEACKGSKAYLGLKIKKTGSGLKTEYDIETNPELPNKAEVKSEAKKEESKVPELPKADKVVA